LISATFGDSDFHDIASGIIDQDLSGLTEELFASKATMGKKKKLVKQLAQVVGELGSARMHFCALRLIRIHTPLTELPAGQGTMRQIMSRVDTGARRPSQRTD
jgi:hypothetical protein